jgi:hypothetical protein
MGFALSKRSSEQIVELQQSSMNIGFFVDRKFSRLRVSSVFVITLTMIVIVLAQTQDHVPRAPHTPFIKRQR